MVKTKISKTRKTRKLNKFKGGSPPADLTPSSVHQPATIKANTITSATTTRGMSPQINENNEYETEEEVTEARVFDEQSNVRNKNVSFKTASYSVIDMDITDLKIPIYLVEGNGPIRKIKFYKDSIYIGYAAFTYMHPIFEIQTIYINENQRSSSYGKRILKFLIQYAFEQLKANDIQLNDQTNSRIFNPNQHPNRMYTKSKFVQMKSKNYNKWMSLKMYRYKKFKKTIFRYLRSNKSKKSKKKFENFKI